MKLHLPKLLLTALVTSVCSMSQTLAAGEIFTLTGLNNGQIEMAYATYVKTTYEDSSYILSKEAGDKYSNAWGDGTGTTATMVAGSNIIRFADEDGISVSNKGLTYSFNNWELGGLIVDGEGYSITAGSGDRPFDMNGGTYSINKSFLIDNSTSTTSGIYMAGSQTWSIAKGAKMTMKSNSKGIVIGADSDASGAVAANVDISGAGCMNLQSTLTINAGSALTVNGSLQIDRTISNFGSLTFENGGKLIVSSLENFDYVCDAAAVDYTQKSSGIQSVGATYTLISGNAAKGLATIEYNGVTTELESDGTCKKGPSVNLYYVAANDTVTVGGSNPTAGTSGIESFAVAEAGTLVFADLHSDKSVFKKEVHGTGRVEVTLGSASNGGHGRGVSLGENFHGTLAVLAGWMDLSMFTLADDATLELQNGEHWTESNLTVNQNINVIDSSFSFRNSATTTLAGVVTAEYLNVGTTGNNHGTLKLSNAENDIQYVTVGCAGNQAKLVIAADMEFSKVVVNNSSSSITVDSGKTLTITGSDVEGDDVALAAEGKTVILNEGAKLKLGSDTKSSTSSIGTLTAHTDGNTITLASKATLNKIGTVSSGSVNLTGSGTYNLGAVAKNAAVTSLTADNSSVKLAQDWTGTVKLSGGEHQTGASQLDKCVKNINFNDLGRTGSTVEITSNGLYGYFVGSNQTFNPNIKLTGDLYIQNGSGDKKYTFAGQISGDGSMKITRTAGGTNDLNFAGDIQHWQGELDQSGDKTTNVGLSGSATEVNAAIKNTGSGTLNLTVDNRGQTTTFSKEVKVDKLTITDGSTMTITATETSEGQRAVGDSKLSAKSIEFGKGAQLNVTGSITLDVSSISLKSGMTFTSASDVTLMTVTNGTLTVNNVGSWTGSTYEIDGRNYTTSLGVEDNTLQLKFTAEPLDSMDVYISLNGCTYDSASDMLMLVMVDANGELINDISRYYNVVGIHGEGSWDDVRELVSGDALVGLSLVGAGTSVVGDGASNVGFYGSYKGEGNGQYTDKGQAIPEPATATLSLLALCGLAARRRRRA